MGSFGGCDAVADGEAGLSAFAAALASASPYALVCLDIAMPGLNGHQVLAAIRAQEAALGIAGEARVKVFMTTSSSSPRDISAAFRGECDAYLVKPIRRAELEEQLAAAGLLDVEGVPCARKEP
jgi:two-component system chemotaxis response regulator CheY